MALFLFKVKTFDFKFDTSPNNLMYFITRRILSFYGKLNLQFCQKRITVSARYNFGWYWDTLISKTSFLFWYSSIFQPQNCRKGLMSSFKFE